MLERKLNCLNPFGLSAAIEVLLNDQETTYFLPRIPGFRAVWPHILKHKEVSSKKLKEVSFWWRKSFEQQTSICLKDTLQSINRKFGAVVWCFLALELYIVAMEKLHSLKARIFWLKRISGLLFGCYVL